MKQFQMLMQQPKYKKFDRVRVKLDEGLILDYQFEPGFFDDEPGYWYLVDIGSGRYWYHEDTIIKIDKEKQ